MLRSALKVVHRRTLSFANTTLGFCVLLFVVWSLSFEMLWVLRPSGILGGSGLRGAPLYSKNYTDNIGGVNVEHIMAYEPIDVVYTWVNGSDEQWLAKKKLFVKSKQLSRTLEEGEKDSSSTPSSSLSSSADSSSTNNNATDNNSNSIAGTGDTHAALNNGTDHPRVGSQAEEVATGNSTHPRSSNSSSAGVDVDANRYRDSGELRYSLRSLVQYAPWIRRVYLVTDNQIPSWLNLGSEVPITVVSHADIFPNKSHLPVFSSPAIESHLHRIPGLSKKFIYFNDDVFLGAPTAPEDFTSVAGVQKFHFAWDVPKCAPGCSDTWIGDGYCDRACNVSACNFDYPDCVNATSNQYGGGWNSYGGSDDRSSATFCSKGCPDSWLGDKVCDTRCNNAECAWDMGDCGIDKVLQDFPGVTLQRGGMASSPASHGSGGGNHSNSHGNNRVSRGGTQTHTHTYHQQQHSSHLAVPFGTKAAFFDLSAINVSVTAMNHSASSVVRNAFLLKKHGLLLMTFETEQDKQEGEEGFPHEVVFYLEGEDLRPAGATAKPNPTAPLSGGNNDTQAASEAEAAIFRMSFTLRVLPNLAATYSVLGFPNGTGAVSGYASSCPNSNLLLHPTHTTTTSSRAEHSHAPPVMMVDLAQRAFEVPPSSSSSVASEQGVALTLAVPQHFNDNHLKTDELFLRVTVLARHRAHNQSLQHTAPLCQAVGTASSVADGFLFRRRYEQQQHERCPERLGALVQALDGSLLHRNVMSRNDPETNAHPKTAGSGVLSIDVSHLTLLAPLPAHWQPHAHWVQTRVEVVHVPAEQAQTQAMVTNVWVPEKDSTDSGGEDGNGNGIGIKMCVTATVRWGGKVVQVPQPPARNETAGEPSLLSNGAGSSSNATIAALNATSMNATQLLLNATAAANANVTVPLHEDEEENKEEEQEDTYAKSLIHVNRLYTKKFGPVNRKVPGHAPHMIDRDVVSEMQRHWPEQWEATSSHRTRSVSDMQYSFAYYHYTMNRNKAVRPDIRRFVQREVDTNRDGYIDDNELRTLAALARIGNFTQIRECLFNTTASSNNTSDHAGHRHEQHKGTHTHTTMRHREESEKEELGLRYGTWLAEYRIVHFPTVQHVMDCPLLVDALLEEVDWEARLPTHIVGRESDIAFEMIGDNFTETMSSLDSIRMRKSRFICINDNMQDPAPELVQALHEFFQAYWPFPSVFELPDGQSNAILHTDEYMSSLRRHAKASPADRAVEMVTSALLRAEPWVAGLLSRARAAVLGQLISASHGVTSRLEGAAAASSTDESDAGSGSGSVRKREAKAGAVASLRPAAAVSPREVAAVSAACLFAAMLVLVVYRGRKGQQQQHDMRAVY
jgi:hypothetical protein